MRERPTAGASLIFTIRCQRRRNRVELSQKVDPGHLAGRVLTSEVAESDDATGRSSVPDRPAAASRGVMSVMSELRLKTGTIRAYLFASRIRLEN